jgi:hypothetical protein
MLRAREDNMKNFIHTEGATRRRGDSDKGFKLFRMLLTPDRRSLHDHWRSIKCPFWLSACKRFHIENVKGETYISPTKRCVASRLNYVWNKDNCSKDH